MRLGIDVGGTNTDAVLLNGRKILASVKRPTSENVTDGIVLAIEAVLSKANIDASDIHCVMLGTTQFTNAFVERKGLQRIGVLRLGSPASDALPPMAGWPSDLKSKINPVTHLLPGGYEFDGRCISPFDSQAVINAIQNIKEQGITSIAVSCTYAQMNPAMEDEVGRLIAQEAPDITFTLSSSFGRAGFLERENATLMNASLVNLAKKVIHSFSQALEDLGFSAPLYISQNDGTLISSAYAAKFPVYTFGSGPTNSMRGAAFLTGLQDAVVMDIGGTTTDIGALTHGFPRESSMSVDIGGVRTSFRMPDVLALALGGGTIIRFPDDKRAASECEIGPDSVGFRLPDEAFMFGGGMITASDIAQQSGRAQFENTRQELPLSEPQVSTVLHAMDSLIEDGLDRVKLSKGQVPVILVGGGSVIAPSSLRGASEVLRPEHAAVANAIGAAFAQVGAEAESVVSYDEVSREQAIADIKQTATTQVIAAGACQASVKIIDIDEIYLSYMPGNQVQLRVKAVGDLSLINDGV